MHPHKIISKVFSCLHRESGKKNTRVAAVNVKDTITGIVAYTLNGNHYVSVKDQDLDEFYPVFEGDPCVIGLGEKGVTLIGREEARSDTDDDLMRSMIVQSQYHIEDDDVPKSVKDAFGYTPECADADSEESTRDTEFAPDEVHDLWLAEEWDAEAIAPFISLCTRAEFKKAIKGRDNLASAFISIIPPTNLAQPMKSFRTATQGHYMLQRETESRIDIPLFMLDVVKRIGKLVDWEFVTYFESSYLIHDEFRLIGLAKGGKEVEVLYRRPRSKGQQPSTVPLQKHFDLQYNEAASNIVLNGRHLDDFLAKCALAFGKKFTEEDHIRLTFFVDSHPDDYEDSLYAQFVLHRDPAPNTKFAPGEDSSGATVLVGGAFIVPDGFDIAFSDCCTAEEKDERHRVLTEKAEKEDYSSIKGWYTEWSAPYLSTLASTAGEVVTFIVPTGRKDKFPCTLIGTEGSALLMPKLR